MTAINQNLGLHFSLVKDEFNTQILRSNNSYSNYNAIAGITSGIFSAVATFVGGIYLIEKTPMRSGMVGLGVVFISIGWIISGFAIGGAIFGLGLLISAYKVSKLKFFINELENDYKNNELLIGSDIERALNKLDKFGQNNLINEMNFDQLGFALNTLGEKKFKEIIASIHLEPHQQWMGIFSLSTDNNHTNIVNKLKSRDFKQIALKNPFFNHQLQAHLKSVKNEEVQSTLQNYWALSLDEEPQTNDPMIEIQFNEESLEVNARLIQSYSQYLADILDGRPQDEAQEPLEILDIENVEAFKICLQLLSHQNPPLQLTKDLIIALFQSAHFLEAPKLVKALECYVLDQQARFTEEEIEDIVNECPEFTNVKTLTENAYLQQRMNSTTWEKCWQKAQAIHSDVLKEHCCQYAKAQLKSLLTSSSAYSKEICFWFKCCQDTLGGVDDDEYKDYRDMLKSEMDTQNVRILYELAIETEEDILQQNCVDFCKQNILSLKNRGVWKLGETPKEISEVLYA